MQILVDEFPKSCVGCKYFAEHRRQCNLELCIEWNEVKFKFNDCPLKSLHDHDKELVAKVLGMVRENLKEELLLTKNENQEEAKLKLVKTYSIDLDVLNKIEKEILNGYTKI